MKQVLVKKGQAVVEDIPAPLVSNNTILVEVKYSCISIGTEMNNVSLSKMPLWKRALKQPHNAKKALKMMATNGILRTHKVIKGMLDNGVPSGYSCAGEVIEVGENITDIKVGDHVACAGAQCAFHANVVSVPRNLAVKIPSTLDFDVASTVTLGSIAMQGVRRANPTLGETFVVVGLGILGQITVQLLQANGVKVIGIDLDLSRIATAKNFGMAHGLTIESESDLAEIYRLTDGQGADGVIITAASASDKIVSQSFQMCRKKGRVVLVGDVGLNLSRADFYAKEIDFLISCSYGPGRYDEQYEEGGVDYPFAYVRWTENRNMQEYLSLCQQHKIDIKSLISKTYPITEASKAYSDINVLSPKPLLVLLSYPDQGNLDTHVITTNTNPLNKDKINIGIIGAGSFAKTMHLPNLEKLKQQFTIYAINSRTGHNAKSVAKQYEAHIATTDYQQLLNDENTDAVIICTRHHTHAEMVISALKAGKHVLVEKPLALTNEELDHIETFFKTSDNSPILLTGFNRRFSPLMQQVNKITLKRHHPMIINYRMNAGFIDKTHWVHGEEGGGRNRGEACHIYDLFTYLTNANATSITAVSIEPNDNYYLASDNFSATITFNDGSIANLIYTAMGNKSHPKESMEIFVDGKVILMEDYKSLTVKGENIKPINNRIIDKGQFNELKAFAESILTTGQSPIPLWQQIQATRIANTVEQFLIGN